ncbi:MAG: hypothetical protein ACOYVG_15285 [Bacteroidota bacterium]
MKRFATIVSLGLLLFSLGGYRMLLGYMETASDRAFQANIYADVYDEAMLLHIKVPASTPYGSNSEQYENATGEVDINGVTYHFVKRRFYKDSLELWCVPNIEKIGIRNARDDFFRLAGDYNAGSSTQKSSNQHTVLKFSILDFTGDHSFSWQFRNAGPAQVHYMKQETAYLSDYVNRLERPPQA